MSFICVKHFWFNNDISDDSTGGKVQISQFRTAAEAVCKQANVDQPFMCLDLTFIWALLEHGLGLRPETTIFVTATILDSTFIYLFLFLPVI